MKFTMYDYQDSPYIGCYGVSIRMNLCKDNIWFEEQKIAAKIFRQYKIPHNQNNELMLNTELLCWLDLNCLSCEELYVILLVETQHVW